MLMLLASYCALAAIGYLVVVPLYIDRYWEISDVSDRLRLIEFYRWVILSSLGRGFDCVGAIDSGTVGDAESRERLQNFVVVCWIYTIGYHRHKAR